MEDYSREHLQEWLELWRLTDSAYSELVKTWNLSLNAYLVLELLEQNKDGVEPAVIADTLHVLRQSITVILNDFEKKGWILRMESKSDHRRKRIVLSLDGRKNASQIVGQINRIEMNAISSMTEGEQKMLVELSRRYCKAIFDSKPR